MSNIAIIGGGLAGLTAAWQLHQLGHKFTLYEAAPRLGGTIRTVHRDGFTIELGPDGWVTEKPWAAELARDLGLAHELIPSNDAGRVTHVFRSQSLRGNKLVAMPDGMRMMVPTDLTALADSPLFSAEARAAYAAEPARAAELRAAAPDSDESIASFVLRHFGNEVLHTIAAPLLAGVFGGDVWTLSVRAIMPRFVELERTHGSLITALQSLTPRPGDAPAIFTTLASGTQTLIDRMAAALPPESIQLNSPVTGIIPDGGPWIVQAAGNRYEACDHVILATPAHVTREFLPGLIADTHGLNAHEKALDLLPTEATSAILVAFAFDTSFDLPKGFGFLVPPGESSRLLAATFVDQKFPNRVPSAEPGKPAKRLLRAFFGGASALTLISQDDATLSALALTELEKILGPLPHPAFSLVQRWPLSLPQYAVGHLERMDSLTALLPPNLHLLGNAYRGVGLPDLIREARTLARTIASTIG